jgi:multiple sugar transport system ATP-binding protein
MAQIAVRQIEKRFGAFQAVKPSSLTIEDGEFFCLLGPSGCGKTTTLRMIAGLELPTAGEILIGGEEVAQKRASARDIAFVFQLFALYPHMSVRRNIAFPLVCEGAPRSEIRKRVEEAARILRITPLLDRPVSGLTGGDRQRVALGRAIVRKPKCFLMDEPLGALDTELREAMIAELRALHDRLGATTVYVTHDQLEAMAMADKIAVMNGGTVEQVGTPKEIYDRPVSLFVADFIGSPPMNFLRFRSALRRGDTAVRLGDGRVDVPRTAGDRPEGDLILGVRPEHVRFGDVGPLAGTVVAVEYLGTTQIVTTDTDFGTLRGRAPVGARLHAGQTVRLSFRADKLTLFDALSTRALPTDPAVGGSAYG